MSEMLSVGLDVGTTTTQLVVSRLQAQNRASAFAVPRMEITHREVLYQSAIHFTPLISGELVDGDGIRKIVEAEYAAAGITPDAVDTGAVIITGETSRKENAQTVVKALAEYAGDFVVATAGPNLESVLAAKGAGAVEFSEKAPTLHMDIGGGTSNLALCIDGVIASTGCLNVGGRLLKFDGSGRITYLSPVLAGIIPHKMGDILTEQQAMEAAQLLCRILETAAGLGERDPLFSRFVTAGTEEVALPGKVVVSFSGGVADCIEKELPWLAYGDLGPLLGRAIRESALCRGQYRLGEQTIRATVIGAGCHSVQLSGSTVFWQETPLPLKNLPAAILSQQEQLLPPAELTALIRRRLDALEAPGILCLPGWNAPCYSRVTALADALAAAFAGRPCHIALEADMAKVLGNALALRLPPGSRCLCIDGVCVPPQSYLDIGVPIGPALTVIVKTLIFER